MDYMDAFRATPQVIYSTPASPHTHWKAKWISPFLLFCRSAAHCIVHLYWCWQWTVGLSTDNSLQCCRTYPLSFFTSLHKDWIWGKDNSLECKMLSVTCAWMGDTFNGRLCPLSGCRPISNKSLIKKCLRNSLVLNDIFKPDVLQASPQWLAFMLLHASLSVLFWYFSVFCGLKVCLWSLCRSWHIVDRWVWNMYTGDVTGTALDSSLLLAFSVHFFCNWRVRMALFAQACWSIWYPGDSSTHILCPWMYNMYSVSPSCVSPQSLVPSGNWDSFDHIQVLGFPGVQGMWILDVG